VAVKAVCICNDNKCQCYLITMLVRMCVWYSAGVGRTGVLIGMLTAWSCIEADVAVDMLAIAQQMRDQRPVLIQTPVSISHLYITCKVVDH